jgi:hypothetical protein
MLHKFDVPFESEILALDEDLALFDPDPDWVGELDLSMRDVDDAYDSLGLRAVVKHPEVLSKAWKRTTRDEAFAGATRSKMRRRKRPRAA